MHKISNPISLISVAFLTTYDIGRKSSPGKSIGIVIIFTVFFLQISFIPEILFKSKDADRRYVEVISWCYFQMVPGCMGLSLMASD